MVSKNSRNGTGSYSGNWGAIAEKHKSTQLLTKYLCKDCKKWKSTHQFSKKQLSSYQWKVSNSSHAILPDGASAKLCCRQCVGEQVTELQCNGPCGLYKSLDDFSKNQRTHSETAWCTVCTQWREACEPDVEVKPAPNNQLSYEEEQELLHSASVGGFFINEGDIEGESDSEEDDYIIDDPLASHVAGMSLGNTQSKTSSTAGTYGRVSNDNTLSSLSNPFAGSSERQPTLSKTAAFGRPLSPSADPNDGWTPVDAKRNPNNPGLLYHSYDPAGNRHVRQKRPSNSTTSDSFANPTGSVSKSSWPKISQRKTPMPAFPTISRPQQSQFYDDDDDSSPDVM